MSAPAKINLNVFRGLRRRRRQMKRDSRSLVGSGRTGYGGLLERRRWMAANLRVLVRHAAPMWVG